VKYSDSEYRFLADPISSMVITVLILGSTVPLVKKCIAVLLQQVPQSVNIQSLDRQLRTVDGVLELHDLHVWQLNQAKIIGTVHATVFEGADFMRISDQMKLIMHAHGVHCSTIQPEYLARGAVMSSGDVDVCHEPLCPTEDCHKRFCCVPPGKERPDHRV